jgi:hypothetical protein
LIAYFSGVLREELSNRLGIVKALASDRDRSIADGRRYVEAMLGFELYCHSVLKALPMQHGPGHHPPVVLNGCGQQPARDRLRR